MSTDGMPVKPRRRRVAKTASQQDGSKVKLTLYVTADQAKRFGVHAQMVDQDKSELFGEMIDKTCRRFVVHDRGSGGDQVEQGAA
jgi:hypothetical protein